MLENIKSSYVIKLIFIYVDEREKLKIVKYNKRLQKDIDISIVNYKHFSGRYIIYDESKKGFGKEYDGKLDSLVFEGEYLNGEKTEKEKNMVYLIK